MKPYPIAEYFSNHTDPRYSLLYQRACVEWLMENVVPLLKEARRDWIRDTEWIGGSEGYERPTGSAIRAFSARIDAVLRELEGKP